MRTNLKLLRVKNGLTQEEIATKIDCSRNTYASVENGQSDGNLSFWQNVQKQFNIPDEEMWALMLNE